MNYFKCLFVLLLSVGVVSSVFTQEPSDEEFGQCISGVYSKDPDSFSDWSFPFEMEVGFKRTGWVLKRNKVIILVKTNKESLCTLYTSPELKYVAGIRMNNGEFSDEHYQVFPSSDHMDSSLIESTGSIGNVSTILGLVFHSGSDCRRVNFEAFDKTARRETIIDFNKGDHLYARKTQRTPRSFDELKSACGL